MSFESKSPRRCAAALLLLVTAGCAMRAETWHRPDATEVESQAARRECEAQAAATRAEPVPYGGKGVGLQPGELDARVRDTFNRCMQAKGFTLSQP
jgi:hypothetical protein